jgi:hypothetical protein
VDIFRRAQRVEVFEFRPSKTIASPPGAHNRENSHQTNFWQFSNSQQVPRSNRGRSNDSYPGFKNINQSRGQKLLRFTAGTTHLPDNIRAKGSIAGKR